MANKFLLIADLGRKTYPLKELDRETRSCLEKNVSSDLKRLNPEEVIRHSSG
jgi:hypothetical protein